MLKKNKCSIGYYEAANLICTVCDDACETCHGPGPLQCDSCAPGYSNRSVGYCRPCCRPGDVPYLHHCGMYHFNKLGKLDFWLLYILENTESKWCINVYVIISYSYMQIEISFWIFSCYHASTEEFG